MNITRFSVKRPVGISMLYALVVLLGVFSFSRIGVELLPEVESPYISVMVNYPGASTESVEQQVTKPIEDVLSTISHFKQVRSATRSGRSEIFVELAFGADADLVAIEATKKISNIRGKLPEDITEPLVIKRSANEYPIMEIAVTGPFEAEDIHSVAKHIFREKLQQADGVADVEISGGREREIAVEADKERLNYYGLTLKDIVDSVKGENVLVSSGSVYSENLQTAIRIDSQYLTPEEIGEISIPVSGGGQIPLHEIASVRAKSKRNTSYTRVDGNDAVSMNVYKSSSANIVDTADRVLKQLERLRKEYSDYKFTLIYDQSNFVRNSLRNTLHTLLEGLLTTGFVLYLFLRGWRSSSAVMIAIPVSLVATFFLMYLAGFTFNMMSLMGMALCIGILVDDSIVVLENIHRWLKAGYPADEAAERGRNQVGMAAVAMTLCDIVVFLPIAFMQGPTGELFRQFSLTIVFATLMSLLVSFTLTPMMAARFYAGGLKESQGKLWEALERWEEGVIENYEILLRKCLSRPKKVILSITAAFIASLMLVPLGIVGSEYMPRTDESAIQVNVELPIGYNADRTNEILLVLDDYLLKIPEIKHHMSNVTSTESNGKISISLVKRSERGKSVWDIASDIRRFARDNLGDVKVRVNEIQSSVAGISGGRTLVRSPVQVELKGSDMEQLVRDSRVVMRVFAETEGLNDIKSSYTEGSPELKINIDREKLQFYGTTVAQVMKSFSGAISGKDAGVLANDSANYGQDTEISVKFAKSEGFHKDDLRTVPLPTKTGNIFLGDIAGIEETAGPITIRRVDKERIINIQSNLSDRPLKDVLQEIDAKLSKSNLRSRYDFAGQANNMNDSFREMAMALSMSLILIYLLLAVLYESVLTPFIRMLSLPLGIIGAIFFLLLTNNTINLYSLIGILVMDGLVAKNGTLLIDYTLNLTRKGRDAAEAIVEAGKVRLKPIFMTALTMVVGMLPTALAMTEGSETRVSMAWVIIGGMITSTVFTLFVIPIIFIWIKERFPDRI